MAAPPPKGLDISKNSGASALSAEIVTRTLAFTAVILRFIARRVGRTNYWWDDWAILPAAVLMIPGMVVEIIETNLGLGRHIWWILNNDPLEIVPYSKYIYADELFYSPIIGSIKMSILLLYVRIFGVNKRLWYICYFQMSLVAVWAIVTELLFIFQCTPIWVAWAPARSGGTCFEFAALFIGTNTVSVVMDFTILFTPMYSIWTLQLPTQKKILVTTVLVLGGAEVLLSTIRVVKLSALAFVDLTWDDAIALVWSTVEADVSVICVCIPVMAPLLPQRWLERITASKSRNKGESGRMRGANVALDYMIHTEGGSIDGQDDGHQLVRNHPISINRTTEISIDEENLTSPPQP